MILIIHYILICFFTILLLRLIGKKVINYVKYKAHVLFLFERETRSFFILSRFFGRHVTIKLA